MACKSVMYHYVRPTDTTQPNLFYLNLDDFQRQLDYFEHAFGFVTKTQWQDALDDPARLPDGIVLTFDDGLIDHYRFVYPVLKERGLWGIFYVSSETLSTRQLLSVHQVHYLLGRFGGFKVLHVLETVVDDSVFLDGFYDQLKSIPYKKQTMDAHSLKVKKMINYELRPECKSSVLGKLFEIMVGDQKNVAQKFYLDEKQILEMSREGMSFGAHGKTHNLLTKFSGSELTQEVTGSVETLNDVLDSASNTFCYPYGGPDSWNNQVLSELQELKVRYGFCVESDDISVDDLYHRPLRLPRYDCNEFPHGQARHLK